MTSALTIGDVRESLAGAIRDTTGLNCSPYLLDQIDAPCAMIGRAPFDPRLVLSGAKTVYPFRVHLFVSRQSDIDAQRTIDEFCSMTGYRSIKAAVENGEAWSAPVDYAVVTSVGDTKETESAGVVYFVTEFDVEVCW